MDHQHLFDKDCIQQLKQKAHKNAQTMKMLRPAKNKKKSRNFLVVAYKTNLNVLMYTSIERRNKEVSIFIRKQRKCRIEIRLLNKFK